MEEKKYTANDKIFKQFGTFAPFVATYTNLVLSKYPEAEKDFINRLKWCKFQIRNGEEISFKVFGQMFELENERETVRVAKIYTRKNTYDIDLENPDFSKHFEILEQPYEDKSITSEAQWSTNDERIALIKTLIHELNHLTCRQSYEYYKNNDLILEQDYEKIKDMGEVIEFNCAGGIPKGLKDLDKQEVIQCKAGSLFHEGITEFFAQEWLRKPEFAPLLKENKLAEHKLPWSYKVMTVIIQMQNLLTDDLLSKCYWGGYKKTPEDCKVINQKLVEFKKVVCALQGAEICGVDSTGKLKDDETIKKELKAFIITFNKVKEEYVALLKRQIHKKMKKLKVNKRYVDSMNKKIKFLLDIYKWVPSMLMLMQQFDSDKKETLIKPCLKEIIDGIQVNDKRLQDDKSLTK